MVDRWAPLDPVAPLSRAVPLRAVTPLELVGYGVAIPFHNSGRLNPLHPSAVVEGVRTTMSSAAAAAVAAEATVMVAVTWSSRAATNSQFQRGWLARPPGGETTAT